MGIKLMDFIEYRIVPRPSMNTYAQAAKDAVGKLVAKLVKPAVLHLEVGDAPETVVIFGLPLKSDGTLNWKVLNVGQPINQQHIAWRRITNSKTMSKRDLVDVMIAVSLVNAGCCLKLCLGVAAALDQQLLSKAATSALTTDYLQSGLLP